jgi:hypothetical protein
LQSVHLLSLIGRYQRNPTQSQVTNKIPTNRLLPVLTSVWQPAQQCSILHWE